MSGILQSMLFAGGSPLTIGIDTDRFNLYDALLSAGGWDGISPVQVTIRIAANVFLYSSTSGSAALVIPITIPAASNITIENSGYILGSGGNGGIGVILEQNFPPGTPGGVGGTGIEVTSLAAVSINNQGVVAGGGGGGGGSSEPTGGSTRSAGGGGGCPLGSGGYRAGASASLTQAGAGGVVYGSNGGNGGFYAQSGTSGDDWTGSNPKAGGAGGLAGSAVIGDANITWLEAGTILGALVP